jgi:hypothetical protein
MLSFGYSEKVPVPYKQIFGRVYQADALGNRELNDLFDLLPDGRLSIRLANAPEVVDVSIKERVLSTMIFAGGLPYDEAQSPDGRYRVQIDTFPHQGATEFWLVHTDQANGKFKRAKLNTEWRTEGRYRPRVAASPGGAFFLADDSGTIRLYSAAHLVDIGAFQVAHSNTENRVVALAVSADERLIAGLSSWKDIVLYSVPERRVAFVRQIKDTVGWYDPSQAHILLAGDAEAIITAGVGRVSSAEPSLSVNAFRFIPLPVA